MQDQTGIDDLPGTGGEPRAATQAPPAVSVCDYHKCYRETIAVQGLSFEVPGGAILGLLGPNGAGKTTTLRALAGVIPPTRGHLAVEGFDVVRQPLQAKRRIAFVPDDPNLFDTLTVWEHLELIAAIYRLSTFQASGEQLLAQFELTEKRDTLARELSRGMRQKVAICCVYLRSPTAILLDEPMTGLDPRGIRTLKDSIRNQARQGVAVIISSHLLSLIEDLCSHLLILHKGQNLFHGTMDQARQQYPNLGGAGSLEDIFFRATEQ